MANKLRVIIVEDESRGRNALKALLTQIKTTELIGEAPNVDDAVALIKKTPPDLVLLDIEMPFKNGFDLLAELPERTFDVIFTTAYDSYAIKAIKFSAIDYLLKPIDSDELNHAIDRTIEKRQKSEHQPQLQINNLLENLKSINKQNYKLSLPTFEGALFVPIEEIIRCESDANYTRFHLKNEEKSILVSKTLKEYDELLIDYGFCRVHHSHLINLKYIKKYIKGEGGLVVMVDGTEVEISRRKKEIFQKALDKFASII
ncbi:MAG: LytTR family DNA-binding domain-containing protein [Bacteroidia bacterium]|nr:LytTR family DNA-binding domain-containing protein [Bacteroidia bacterium]MCF8425734.1 LytTR family DNA-binding domain-containing protein [Bacteroidia bacterium]MCF8446394.1 LytTR family DNA-binding domain-containing protein [Bacteroidia bacterium]